MSKVAIQGNASGTATFTVAAPVGTGVDRTLTLPDEAGTVVTTAGASFTSDVSTTAQFSTNAQGSTSDPAYGITSGSIGVNGMYVPAANSLAFIAGATERMRIDSSGRALIGTTGSIGSSGGATLQVSSNNSNNWATYIQNYNASPYGIYVHYSSASPDGAANEFLYCGDSTTGRFLVKSDGDVQNHDNSYSGMSDQKLKEQIVDSSSQWEDIKALNIRKFKFKSDVAEKGDSDELWRLGVIAQEVEAAGMSGLVKTSQDIIFNEDGERVESGEYTKSVKYSILYMKAVKALQEAIAKIETLETTVADLQTRVTALEATP